VLLENASAFGFSVYSSSQPQALTSCLIDTSDSIFDFHALELCQSPFQTSPLNVISSSEAGSSKAINQGSTRDSQHSFYLPEISVELQKFSMLVFDSTTPVGPRTVTPPDWPGDLVCFQRCIQSSDTLRLKLSTEYDGSLLEAAWSSPISRPQGACKPSSSQPQAKPLPLIPVSSHSPPAVKFVPVPIIQYLAYLGRPRRLYAFGHAAKETRDVSRWRRTRSEKETIGIDESTDSTSRRSISLISRFQKENNSYLKDPSRRLISQWMSDNRKRSRTPAILGDQWHASIRYVRNHYPKNQKKRLCMREISVADGRGRYRRCHSLAMRPFSGSLDGTCSSLRDCWSHRNVDAWISGLCRRHPRRLFHVYTIWRERHKMQRHFCRHIHQPVWPSNHTTCDCGDVNFTRR